MSSSPCSVLRCWRLEPRAEFQNLQTPFDHACTIWQHLCAGVREFVDDLQQHIRLENEVLFPQFEAQRS